MKMFVEERSLKSDVLLKDDVGWLDGSEMGN